MPRPPNFGIIYNWDGAPHYYSEVPQSIEDFVDKVYAPVEDTQIGAHFWCVGEHQSRWQSEVMEMVGDVHDRTRACGLCRSEARIRRSLPSNEATSWGCTSTPRCG